MGVPRVNRFCFCTNLRTGSLIIGFIAITCSLVELFFLGMLVTLKVDMSGNKHILYVAYASVIAIRLLFAILMVIGISKRLAWLTLPWTIWTGMLVAVFLTLSCLGLTYVLQEANLQQANVLTLLVFYFVRCGVWCYFIIIVHSHHKEIMEDAPDLIEGRSFLRNPTLPRASHNKS